MACPTKYQKSSLRAYNTTEQSVASGGLISFPNVGYQSGVSISLDSSNQAINLKKPGLYYITADIIVTNETANTDVTISLLNNGVAVPGATSEVTVTAIGDFEPCTISAIIPMGAACPCLVQNEAISFSVTGTTTVIGNINVNVIKLA